MENENIQEDNIQPLMIPHKGFEPEGLIPPSFFKWQKPVSAPENPCENKPYENHYETKPFSVSYLSHCDLWWGWSNKYGRFVAYHRSKLWLKIRNIVAYFIGIPIFAFAAFLFYFLGIKACNASPEGTAFGLFLFFIVLFFGGVFLTNILSDFICVFYKSEKYFEIDDRYREFQREGYSEPDVEWFKNNGIKNNRIKNSLNL